MRFLILAICFVAFIANSEAIAQNGDALSHYVKAEKLREAKRMLEAIDEYNEAIKIEPTNEKFHYQKGVCYLLLKQEDNAIRAFIEVLKINPANSTTHLRMAWLFQRKENLKKAVYHFDKVYEHSKNIEERVKSKITIIKTLYKINKLPEAEKHINDVLKIKPHEVKVMYYASKMYNSQKKYTQARDIVLKALDIIKSNSPKSTAHFYYELCYAYYHLQAYNDLALVLPKANHGPFKKEVAKLTPEYKYFLARCYFAIYEYEKSRDLLTDALKQDHSNQRVFDLQIKIAEATADKSHLIQHTQEMIKNEVDPQRKAKAYGDISRLLLSQGDYEKTISAAEESLKINDGNYVVRYNKAIALHKLGRNNEAIEELLKLLKFNGLDVSTKAKYNFALGLVSIQDGDLATAKRALISAKLDNNFRYAATYVLENLKGADKNQN